MPSLKKNICMYSILMTIILTASSVGAQSNAAIDFQNRGGVEYVQGANSDYQPLVDVFFDNLKAGKGSTAVDDLFSDTPWQSEKRESASAAKSELSSLYYSAGKVVDYKLHSVRQFFDRHVYLLYFVYFEKKPAVILLELYRPKNEWLLFDVTVKENSPVNIDNFFETGLID